MLTLVLTAKEAPYTKPFSSLHHKRFLLEQKKNNEWKMPQLLKPVIRPVPYRVNRSLLYGYGYTAKRNIGERGLGALFFRSQ